jgi:hypothetical protein
MTLFQLASYIHYYKKKFRGGSKFDPLLQMKRNYRSNQATSKNAFLGAGYPLTCPKNDFQFYSRNLLNSKK